MGHPMLHFSSEWVGVDDLLCDGLFIELVIFEDFEHSLEVIKSDISLLTSIELLNESMDID